MPRPAGHGPGYEHKRQEITDLAATLFARKGYSGTGIAEIGTAVGLAKGALYYYIGSKENLLVEIQNRVMDPLVSGARQVARLPEDPVVRLRLVSEILLANILRRLDHIWVYEHDYRHLTGSNRTRFLRRRREFERIVTELIDEAKAGGAIRSIDTRMAMLQYLNMHNHTFQWVRADGPWDAAYLSREYCATLFGGLGGDVDMDAVEQRVMIMQKVRL